MKIRFVKYVMIYHERILKKFLNVGARESKHYGYLWMKNLFFQKRFMNTRIMLECLILKDYHKKVTMGIILCKTTFENENGGSHHFLQRFKFIPKFLRTLE